MDHPNENEQLQKDIREALQQLVAEIRKIRGFYDNVTRVQRRVVVIVVPILIVLLTLFFGFFTFFSVYFRD
jgi:hypothetical protein